MHPEEERVSVIVFQPGQHRLVDPGRPSLVEEKTIFGENAGAVNVFIFAGEMIVEELEALADAGIPE
jgi:hypothetical protein